MSLVYQVSRALQAYLVRLDQLDQVVIGEGLVPLEALAQPGHLVLLEELEQLAVQGAQV